MVLSKSGNFSLDVRMPGVSPTVVSPHVSDSQNNPVENSNQPSVCQI